MYQAVRTYAGIGARATPNYILAQMAKTALHLESRGFHLHSGGARGADSAFASRVTSKTIFRPEDATDRAMDLASMFHPAWDRCNSYVRRLHGRNAMIVLGKDLNARVGSVICWTPRGHVIGGTGLAIRLAQFHGITIYNWGKPQS